MKKLTLDPEALRVESFATAPSGDGARGTVHARQEPTYDAEACTDACSLVLTCHTCATCDEGCDADGGDDLYRRIILYGE